MVHASLFSGIGGPEVAAVMMGWDNAFHCEINPFGKAVLDYWFPNSESYEDITKSSFKKWKGKIDVLKGGFPCQPFSYAGKRGGREDERYLWPEMLRVIGEIRPTWVIGENVAGITTMVEGGVCTDLGGRPTLFGEGDDLHEYCLRQSFTIERICRDLEHLGYSVQPMLIPAASVGAPHRRDRVFIIAYAADTDRGDDTGRAGEDEGKSGEERVQERDEIRESGIAGDVRSEIQGVTEDTERIRWICSITEKESENRGLRMSRSRDYVGICGEERISSSDSNCNRRNEGDEHLQSRIAEWNVPVSNGRERNATDTELKGLERKNELQCGETKRIHLRRDLAGYGCESLHPEHRWEGFPTVSPVHRGNDGIPFPLDNLTIPQTRWRTESLKAYGNAIVPQVIYRIFQCIDAVCNK